MSGKVFLHIQVRGEDTFVQGSFSNIDAILQLRSAIEHLQRSATPTFDASWGEQPMPLIAPSAEQVNSLSS